MFDWVEDQATFVVVLVVLLVVGVLVRRWLGRTTSRAADNLANGITPDQVGDPMIDKQIMSQSVEVHFDATVEQVAAQVLGAVKLPFMLDRIGEQAWADRKTLEEAESYGRLEPTQTGSRARMLWCKDAGGLAPLAPDWRTMRARLLKAATAVGIPAREEQGPRMDRVPVGDAPAHLRPEQAALAPHQWRAVDVTG